jgi:hypothetical protein
MKRPLRPAALLSVLALAACASSQSATPRSEDPFSGGAANEEVLLTVQNNDFRDASIYVYWNGVRDRVGEVTGKTSETFRMSWRSERVELGIDFVGGGGYRSESIDVTQGDHLNFVILSDFLGN